MKEQKQDTLQQSQPSGSTTGKENLNTELIKKRKVGIFDLVEIELTGEVFLGIGRVKLKSYESVEEAIEEVGNSDWDLIIQLIATLIEAHRLVIEGMEKEKLTNN